MKIIIIGAGRVGRGLVRHLDAEDDNITVIDSNPTRLDLLRSSFDVQLIQGIGSDPKTLRTAGVEETDLVIAVTREDEVNILACHVAHRLSKHAQKLCRVRLPGYWTYRGIIATDVNDETVIDHFISPQRVVTRHIRRLLETPGSLQVIDFADGAVRLVAIKAYFGGLLVNKRINVLKDHLPANIDTRIVAIYRDGKALIPSGNTVLQVNDEVFFIAKTEHIRLISSELRRTEKPYSSIIIAGGGHVGHRLAQTMEDQIRLVKIIESSKERCRYIAERLDHSVVLQGDCTDRTLLSQEEIGNTNVFMALTNNDEANIISSMMAKEMGASKVMTLINNADYAPLLENSQIDVTIAPDLITISSMLAFARQGDTTSAHTLRRGAAEALEIVVHGDSASSKVIGRRIDEISLPMGVSLGAIVRDEEVIIAHGDTFIFDMDHIIVFITDRRLIPVIESLFGSTIL